jgi:hypothetical protein
LFIRIFSCWIGGVLADAKRAASPAQVEVADGRLLDFRALKVSLDMPGPTCSKSIGTFSLSTSKPQKCCALFVRNGMRNTSWRKIAPIY